MMQTGGGDSFLRCRLAHAILGVLFVGTCASADEPASEPVKKRKTGYEIYFDVGPFKGREDFGQLGGGYGGLAIGVGFGQRFTRFLATEAEIGVSSRSHDVQGIPSLQDEDVSLNIYWLGYSVKGVLPIKRFEGFAGAGIGVALTDLATPADASSVTTQQFIEEDTTYLAQYLLGVNIALTPHSWVGLEFRSVRSKSDLGTLTGGETEIGGDAFLAVYRFRFVPGPAAAAPPSSPPEGRR